MNAREGDEQGNVLLLVMMWVFAVTVVAVTLLTVGLKYAEILDMSARQRQAYWLARAEARSVMQGIKSGTPTATAWSDVYPFGTVQVQVSYAGTWNVKIDSEVAGALNTLTFSYNPGLAKITSWQDNGPG